MVIPRSLREEAGLAEGALMKVSLVKGGKILLTPQPASGRAVLSERRKKRDPVFRELAQVVAEIRQEAKEKGLDKMPMSEINAAVAAVRRAQKKASKRSAK